MSTTKSFLVLSFLALSMLLGCGYDGPPPAHVAPFEGATHIIAPDADYYQVPPEAGLAPAGRFKAGTKIEILERKQKYVKVRTGEGTEAYVKTKSVKKQTPEG